MFDTFGKKSYWVDDASSEIFGWDGLKHVETTNGRRIEVAGEMVIPESGTVTLLSN